MDVGVLLMLVQVVDAGSLSEAARRMGASKSTLSRKLKKLEDELGVRLLERSPRKIGLTEPGRRLVERGRRVAGEVADARREVRSLGERPRGTVRVAASVSFAEHFLSPVVFDFLRRQPDVDLDLVLDASSADLVRDGIDVAIRAGMPDPQSPLIAKKIGHVPAYVTASPLYLQRHGEPGRVAELAEHDALVYRPGREPSVWTLEDEEGATHRVRPRVRLAVNSHPLCIEGCEQGLGLALVPAPFAHGAFEAGRLVRVLPTVASPKAWLCALFPHRDQPPAVRAFIDHVVAEIGRRTWLL